MMSRSKKILDMVLSTTNEKQMQTDANQNISGRNEQENEISISGPETWSVEQFIENTPIIFLTNNEAIDGSDFQPNEITLDNNVVLEDLTNLPHIFQEDISKDVGETASSSQNIIDKIQESNEIDIKSISEDEYSPKRLVSYSDSDLSSNDGRVKRKKRCQVNEMEWKVEINRQNRERGEMYYGKQKVNDKWIYDIRKAKRKQGCRCRCVSKRGGLLKCDSITDEERKIMYERFWALTWKEKRALVDGLVKLVPITRKRDRKQEDVSRRLNSLQYHLSNNGNSVRVCKTMFCNTLAIGKFSALHWKKTTINGTVNTKERNKITSVRKSEEITQLGEFFMALPKLESHYCRKTTKKLYLESNWRSKTELYRFYKNEWCSSKNVQPLSVALFNNTMDCQNIALYKPKKDKCDVCATYETGNTEQGRYEIHQLKKEEARREKETDKNQKSVPVYTMDLQAVLQSPKSNVSLLYYKTKLSVHNMSIYELNSKDAHCFLWNETEGGLNSEEFATIVSKFFTEITIPNLGDERTIIMYSDGCTYQNRNCTMANALLNCAMENKITIIQKFLETGHTQMEADSIHSSIERKIRNRKINVPGDYIQICQDARRNPTPYKVHYLCHEDFKSFNTVSFLSSIRPGKKKGDPKVTDLRAIKYVMTEYVMCEVFYKLRFSDEWSLLPQRRNNVRSKAHDLLPRLHSERLKITDRKFNDLQELKKILPRDHHHFYDSLPH